MAGVVEQLVGRAEAEKRKVKLRPGPASGLIGKDYRAGPALDAGMLGGTAKQIYIEICS